MASNVNNQWIKPRWLRDLFRFLPIKSQFVLSGNIRDIQLREDKDHIGWHKLINLLKLELLDYGFEQVLYYNPVTGFDIPLFLGSAEEKVKILTDLGIPQDQSSLLFNVETFAQVMSSIVEHDGPPVALLIDFAAQLVMVPEHLVKAEHNAFTKALVLSELASPRPYGKPRRPFYNSLIWIVNKEGDLPDWLTIGNPKIRQISISVPDRQQRHHLAKILLSSFSLKEPELTETLQTFMQDTEGLLLSDLTAIIDLARSENVSIDQISDAVRRYKVGVTEDPWMKIERQRVSNGENYIKQRVKGQDHAVTHIMDIIKRAITGIGSLKRGGRPRGVVFLAGPTGVGKTELAKTVTNLLFGDDSAYIRFDMSEFSAEHADQRLIGAPPGYVGYDVGGELTNAVREKPFSVVLFDEIEKAHPRILDKFLQVLDDGVLTSGRGERVYFSETLIIFTSNLGIYKALPDGSRQLNASPSDPYEKVESQVVSEIERYFKLEINRPELLNRMGDNIIVFDFIREEVGSEIFDLMIDNHMSEITQQLLINIQMRESARLELKQLCLSDLSNGGRGIRNKIEAHFINPLSRELFEIEPKANEKLIIQEVNSNNINTSMIITKQQ
ncbi:AAA family ATPase [Aliikangiella sp. IMCC44359]|uniref:AAA family ATPase n=1 Tax=Aliikangiella sp. IMCC44359 TaxID=3459125 RepID=UPI00403ADA95